jgi:hypothetical protein
MKKADATKLKKGNVVQHRRYGLCVVDKVVFTFDSFFGVVIIPSTAEGSLLLIADSRTDIPRFLETSIRKIKLPDRDEYKQ